MAMSLDSTQIMASAGTTLSEALEAQLPGLSVLQSDGSTVSGARVRLRGPNTMVGSSEPMLIVDGLRVDARQEATLIAFGTRTSRLDDVARSDVARVDVLPGAAAAMMFGPGAAHGAIVITTKRGQPGPLHWRARAESRLAQVATSFPANYHMNGVSTTNGQPVADCWLMMIARGQCTPQSLSVWNPLERASPFRTAWTAAGNAGVSGGFGNTGIYAGASAERALGVTDNDDLGRLSLRTNVQRQIGSTLNVEAGGSFVRSSAGMSPSSNVISNGLFGTATDDAYHGFRPSASPDEARERDTHWSSGVSAEWQARPWLRARASYGKDHVGQDEIFRAATLSGGNLFPFVTNGEVAHSTNTLRTSVSASHELSSRLRMRGVASLGYDEWKSNFHTHDSTGTSTAGVFSSATYNAKSKISGPWVREQVSLGDRGLLAAALRWELGETRFGDEPSGPLRSASASWLLGTLGAIQRIRVRAAYGEGRTWFDDDQILFQQTLFSGAPSASNRQRASELEAGVDANVGNRISVAFTAYHASDSELLTLRPVTGPFGGIAYALDGGGGMKNEGLELLTGARVLESRALREDLTVALSAMRNRVRTLGSHPYTIGDGWRAMPGYPLNGLWATPYTFADANSDGLIAPEEVHLGDTAVYLGSALPTREIALRSLTTFARRVELMVVLDHRGGYRVANNNERLRCARALCRAMQDPSAPLSDQARAVYASSLFQGATSGYIEDASFVKLREVTLRWSLPASLARHLGVPNGAISLAGRNLATWTRYGGLDPELSSQGFDVLPRAELGQMPLTRQYALRFDVAR